VLEIGELTVIIHRFRLARPMPELPRRSRQMGMRKRSISVIVASAMLFGSVAMAQPQRPPDTTGSVVPGQTTSSTAIVSCPPSQLCLEYQPADRPGRAIDPSAYKYPFHDPYVATITAGALSPDGVTPGVTREMVHVPLLRRVDPPPLLKGRDEASVALYRQKGPAPLLFILGGIGSNPYFGLGPYYAGLFHRQGAHVVVLPSPMSWNFAFAASRSGVPGYAPDDARDLYRLMEATLALLRARYGVEVTGVDFMGASLGAVQGAYLSVLDEDEGRIGIRSYLLLNPPPDLGYAFTKLTEWQARGATLGRERATKVGLKARGLIEDYIDERRLDPNASFDRAAREFSRFSTEELQFVIAEYIRSVLPELVYVTQAIDDQQVLKAPRAEDRARLREAKGFTLKDYEQKIAIPRLRAQQSGANGGNLAPLGSLRSIIDRIRVNPRVHIMHNADDPLAEPAALEELSQAMGSQMTLYPYGGHLGNLWYAENREEILRFFRAPMVGLAPSGSTGPAEAPEPDAVRTSGNRLLLPSGSRN
jgi:hypothetical protein